MKYFTTILSGFLTLIAYLIPILAFNKVLNGDLYFKNGLIITIIICIINILAFIHGDRIVNFLFLILTLIAIGIFSFPMWGSIKNL